ncbi:uncharacterized protein isoform X3 [Choristoneura fumiferana]|uniref:uncharacterized protein isoform X3 n=1 Tax=Choristoneura fumiferana TaxID=7141 RepID=UPI003D157AD6
MATAAKHWTLRAEAKPTATLPSILFLTFRTIGFLHSMEMKLTGFGAYARPVPTPKMPPGLLELMEGLTKDILKNNPENVYEFCAGHMHKLLELRNGGGTETAPKYQLSLDEKIKIAQEKVRQRINDRQLQYQKKMSNISNEILDHKINVTEPKSLAENALENITTSKQPVHHGDELVKISEVEIFLQPDVTITTTDNNKDDVPQKQEVKENLAVSAESVQDSTFITAEDKVVKCSSVLTKLEPSNNLEQLQSVDLIDELKKEAEQSEVVLEKDTPAPLEGIQSESSINGVKKELNENVVGVELTSDILKNEESRGEVEMSENEKMNDENTETVSEIKQVIKKPENVSNANTKSISNDTDNTIFPTKSEIISMPSNSVPDIEIEINRDDKKTIFIDVQKVIKNEQEEKEMNPDQQIIENLNTEKVPLDIGKGVTDNGKEIQEKVADSELNRDATESIENTIVLDEGENNYSKTIIVESQTGVDQTSNESVLDPLLENSVTEENQPIDKHPDLTTQHVTENETLATVTNLGNKELSDDHVDKNVLHNDIDKKSQVINVTEIAAGKKNHITTELYASENDIHNNPSNMKTDMTTENAEPIENREGNGMDLETAAITIQKVFRTFLFSKSRASTSDDTANDNSLDEEIEKKNFQDEPEYIISSANLNKERRALGISRMDTVLQTVNEEKSLSLSTDDSSTLSSAATTIQAHIRGFLVRNRMASYKTASNSSLVNSEGPSTKSLDGDINEPKKTILNIHIVPERGQFMSRDESMLTSIDLPLDNSPPSSINLHPLGYDKSEPRKQLKREDAIQSISPPSNNSGKLSEEVDSVKDSLELKQEENSTLLLTNTGKQPDIDTESCDTTLTISSTADTVVDAEIYNATEVLSSPEQNSVTGMKNGESATNFSSDEMDVVTPFPNAQEIESDEKPKLVHTGEFHDIVLQTQVKRSESSVVRGE